MSNEGRPEPATEELSPVDLRILQANERTMLAWVRTGVALMALGFLLARVSIWLKAAADLEVSPSLVWLGAAFVVVGTGCNIAAARRFWRVRSALLAGLPVVPGIGAAVSLALGVALLGVLMVAYVLLL